MYFIKKGRTKSSSEQLQDNNELNTNETSANWKQLAEQTGSNIVISKLLSECRNCTKLNLKYMQDTSVTQEFFVLFKQSKLCIRIKRNTDKVKNNFVSKQLHFFFQLATKTRMKQIPKNFFFLLLFSLSY